MESRIWIFFVALAGCCWGAYVPFVAQGGRELKDSYASFLCVGVAYFLIAILFPLGVFWARGNFPVFTAKGSFLATMAGVAGALGALCVIFATFQFKGPLRRSSIPWSASSGIRTRALRVSHCPSIRRTGPFISASC
jgi:hypothetical protein